VSPQRQKNAVVGVISDTHGLLRPEALAALEGVEAIIHAGDVGDPAILSKLELIAPVTAVRGNIDTAVWARVLDLDPAAGGFAAVIFGHSHQPVIEWRGEVLLFNPGSAGPRRFSLPISVGKLIVENGKVKAKLVMLE